MKTLKTFKIFAVLLAIMLTVGGCATLKHAFAGPVCSRCGHYFEANDSTTCTVCYTELPRSEEPAVAERATTETQPEQSATTPKTLPVSPSASVIINQPEKKQDTIPVPPAAKQPEKKADATSAAPKQPEEKSDMVSAAPSKERIGKEPEITYETIERVKTKIAKFLSASNNLQKELEKDSLRTYLVQQAVTVGVRRAITFVYAQEQMATADRTKSGQNAALERLKRATSGLKDAYLVSVGAKLASNALSEGAVRFWELYNIELLRLADKADELCRNVSTIAEYDPKTDPHAGVRHVIVLGENLRDELEDYDSKESRDFTKVVTAAVEVVVRYNGLKKQLTGKGAVDMAFLEDATQTASMLIMAPVTCMQYFMPFIVRHQRPFPERVKDLWEEFSGHLIVCGKEAVEFRLTVSERFVNNTIDKSISALREGLIYVKLIDGALSTEERKQSLKLLERMKEELKKLPNIQKEYPDLQEKIWIFQRLLEDLEDQIRRKI